jgi:hypothetical protein
VQRLMKLVAKNFFGQVLVTDTDLNRVQRIFADNDLESKLFEVSGGKVSELNKIEV